MTTDGRLFDRYVVVDWSAKNSPGTGADSIWIAVHDGVGEPTLTNPPTRHAAALELDELVDAPSARTLLAVDVSLGYPTGSSNWFGLDGATAWTAMWQLLEREIVDDERNRSNRFDVAASLNRRGGAHGAVHCAPFWGRHRTNDLAGLTVTKPPEFPVGEFRVCDRRLRGVGRRPASPWQLLGAGSVGSQSLTLIPVLERLRRRVGADVWPFSTGLVAPTLGPGGTVIAEIWPTWFDIDAPVHWIRDAAQVDGVARRIAAADSAGDLRSWFEPVIPAPDAEAVVGEEGWILGVPGDDR